jgi:hypothetical protein
VPANFRPVHRLLPRNAEISLGGAGRARTWNIIRCLIAALILTVSVYPDVIFSNASLSTANVLNVTLSQFGKRAPIFPEREGRDVAHGYYDMGGSGYQSEPAAQFMARTLRKGQSVYWNPYSATGSFGLETLVDIKTSPMTMTVALLGGSNAAFHIVYLAFTVLGVFCLLMLLTVEFRLSFLAALGGGVTFLLNGYFVANSASNVSQVWLYFPVLALGLVSYARAPRLTAFLLAVFGAVLILATTFLPTTLMVTGTTMLVGMSAAAGFAAVRSESRREIFRRFATILCGQAVAVALALAALAVVYLPVIEAMDYMSTGEFYANRRFYPANLFDLVSLFTPKHAFEAYNAMPARARELSGNAAFHQGIVGALLVTQVIRAWPLFHRILVAAMGAALLMLLARVYGLPVFSTFVDALPVVGHLGQQYVWIAIALLFTLLLPFGLEAVLRDGTRVAPLIVTALVIIAALAYTTSIYRIDRIYALGCIAVVAGLTVSTMLILLNHRPRRTAGVVGVLLVLLSWAELTFYVNHERLSRLDLFAEPPAFVRFLQSTGGQHRVASYGHWGIPPEYGSAYGIYQIGSMNFQLFPRYEDLFNRLILPDPKHRFTSFATLARAPDTEQINLKAYDFLGARYLTLPVRYSHLHSFMERSSWRRAYEDSNFVIFENPDPMPRAFLTHRLVKDRLTPVDRGESPLALATSDDEIFIAQARREGIADVAVSAASPGDEPVAIRHYDHDHVQITAAANSPGILVLNDSWHPNWSVTVDGAPGYIGRVDETFRGVVLPAGRHVVEMRYAPRSLTAARGISFATLLFILTMCVFRGKIDGRLRRMIGPHGSPALT